jgi:hypothetical protein
MGSGAMIYIPSFIKAGYGIQKLTGAGGADTQAAWWSHKHVFFFQNKAIRLKTEHDAAIHYTVRRINHFKKLNLTTVHNNGFYF